jgi:hypothetical protein
MGEGIRAGVGAGAGGTAYAGGVRTEVVDAVRSEPDDEVVDSWRAGAARVVKVSMFGAGASEGARIASLDNCLIPFSATTGMLKI